MSDAMQEFYDQAEDIVTAIEGAEGCTGALVMLLAQIERDMPDLMQQASAVAGAIGFYLADARRNADMITRRSMN